MKTFNKLIHLIKYCLWGVLFGFFILFFMPNSKLTFNWQNLQNIWAFYQAQASFAHPQNNQQITEQNLSFSGAVEKAFPSVVSINVLRKELRDSNQLGPNEKILDVGLGIGSGIILNRQGYIVTNHHVIADADQVIIKLSDGRNSYVDLVGYDALTDIAVLKTDLIDLHPAVFANSGEVKVGDLTMAIGNPFGTTQSVSLGIISATNVVNDISNRFLPLIQTDAALSTGNSGGALINLKGEIIGINQRIISSRGGGQTGLNYAIPIERATYMVDEIIRHGRVRRNTLGISSGELQEQDHKQRFPNIPFASGFFVAKVDQNSPAEKAGIKVGDFVIEYEGQKLTGVVSFYNLFYETTIGKKVEMKLIRDGEIINIEAQLLEQMRANKQN